MTDQTGGALTHSTAAPPPLPLPQRRPRVREVSSRFMTPLIPSNSTTPTSSPNTSDIRRSKSTHRRQHPKTDENSVPEPNHNSDRSSAFLVPAAQKKQSQQRATQHALPYGEPIGHPHTDFRVSHSPDTPPFAERNVPSRYRQVPATIRRSNLLNSNGFSAMTMAASLLQRATSDSSISSSDNPESCISNASNQGTSSCHNSSLCVALNLLEDKNHENYSKIRDNFAGSLNFSRSAKNGGAISVSLSPCPPSSGLRPGNGLDVRKGKKATDRMEDEHYLNMLSNRYLQWRLANAKAEACLCAQKQETEKRLWSLGIKISDIRNNVKRKRSEFGLVQGMKSLITIVEAQMPFLDEWSSLVEDYSDSLSGTTNAMLSSSFRLPVSVDVRIDISQLEEALNSAIKVVELIGSDIQRFIHEAEQMDSSISEIARTVRVEKARIEECGYMLSKTCSLQVMDCSLRGNLMQLPDNHHHQTRTSEEALL